MAKQGQVLDWLVTFIGDRHTVTRQEVLAADKNGPGGPGTISCYMTTAAHYGHVEGNCSTRYSEKKRIAYLRRVKRGVYTLTEKGWARYRQIQLANTWIKKNRLGPAFSLKSGDLSGSVSKSELATIMADLNGIPMVTIRATELTEEDLTGLSVVHMTDGARPYKPPAWMGILGDLGVTADDGSNGEYLPIEVQNALHRLLNKEDDRPDHCDYGLL